ncbi:MAG: hypothetical protein GQ475_02805 [Methylococcaceae bacterium]|nr:hypothetical protein [Methylococcaceae bacterium]
MSVDVLGGNQEFNAEGIVVYNNGILIINDNYPGNTQTTLRYITSAPVRAFRDLCLAQ